MDCLTRRRLGLERASASRGVRWGSLVGGVILDLWFAPVRRMMMSSLLMLTRRASDVQYDRSFTFVCRIVANCLIIIHPLIQLLLHDQHVTGVVVDVVDDLV